MLAFSSSTPRREVLPVQDQLGRVVTRPRPTSLVSTASRAEGLGFAVAGRLADLGYRVVLAGRRLDRTEDLVRRLAVAGRSATAVRLDLTDPASITAAAAFISGTFGRLDVLVNNASTVPDFGSASMVEADMAAVRAALDVDVIGTWALIQACLPLLRTSPAARVVNVSSGAARKILAGAPVSAPAASLAKFTLNALTAALAGELRASGILVNAVDPGEMTTHPGQDDAGSGRPAADSAPGVVWAATLPADGPTGGFFFDGEPVDATA